MTTGPTAPEGGAPEAQQEQAPASPPTPPTPPEAQEEPQAVDVIKDPEAFLRNHEKLKREGVSLRKQLDEATAQLEEQRKAAMTEQERLIEEAREAAREEVRQEYHAKLLSQAVMAAATGKLADPEDATKFLDMSKLDPDKPADIDAAIAELVKVKPHLAARRRGTIDQGPQGPGVETEDGSTWLRRVAGR